MFLTILAYLADAAILGTYALIALAPEGKYGRWFDLANGLGAPPLIVIEVAAHAWPVLPITVTFGVLGWLGVWAKGSRTLWRPAWLRARRARDAETWMRLRVERAALERACEVRFWEEHPPVTFTEMLNHAAFQCELDIVKDLDRQMFGGEVGPTLDGLRFITDPLVPKNSVFLLNTADLVHMPIDASEIEAAWGRAGEPDDPYYSDAEKVKRGQRAWRDSCD